MRLKKRNNYTLSHEAQTIIDTIKNKSKFVSEAIVVKGNGFYTVGKPKLLTSFTTIKK